MNRYRVENIGSIPTAARYSIGLWIVTTREELDGMTGDSRPAPGESEDRRGGRDDHVVYPETEAGVAYTKLRSTAGGGYGISSSWEFRGLVCHLFSGLAECVRSSSGFKTSGEYAHWEGRKVYSTAAPFRLDEELVSRRKPKQSFTPITGHEDAGLPRNRHEGFPD